MSPDNRLGYEVDQIRRRKERRFQLKVFVSWSILFFFLLFLFSGLEISLFGLVIKTITLDLEFIKRSGPDIGRGVTITIILSVSSITLASMLALLSALGRMSRIPLAYATSTFYISLVRGTPLLLQIFFHIQ